MSVQYVIPAALDELIQEIVREMLTGTELTTSLKTFNGCAVLRDGGFMADYLGRIISEQGSDLRVEHIESYRVAFGDLYENSGCCLALVDPAGSRRVFALGWWNGPAVGWVDELSGDELEASRARYERKMEVMALLKSGFADLDSFTAHVAARVRTMMEGATLTDQQKLDIEAIQPLDQGLVSWAMVCRILGTTLTEAHSK